jgi:outer membrane protein OmpA-like peptidoglycan-associated protein
LNLQQLDLKSREFYLKKEVQFDIGEATLTNESEAVAMLDEVSKALHAVNTVSDIYVTHVSEGCDIYVMHRLPGE